MKKFYFIIFCFFMCMPIFAGNYTYERTTSYYTQIGISNFTNFDLTTPDIEIGGFYKNAGLGVNFKYGFDNLGDKQNEEFIYIGPVFKYKTDVPFINMIFNMGIGFGQNSYYPDNDYSGYYHKHTDKEHNDYIIPNFGVSMYISLCKYVDIGFEPTFMYFISNQSNIDNFTTWNLAGKIKFNF